MRLVINTMVNPGQVIWAPDLHHPEALTAWMLDGILPDGRCLVCHPDDEHHVREIIARADSYGIDIDALFEQRAPLAAPQPLVCPPPPPASRPDGS